MFLSRTTPVVSLAAAPTYAKSHSQGEYVFDHGWAQAYAQAGGRYYPKIQVAVPFTPVTGRRLLVAKDAPPETLATLVAGLRGLRQAAKASSVHVTFPDARDRDALALQGFSLRTGEQFHFANRRLSLFRRFSGRPLLAQAQEHQTRTPRSARRRHYD